ncbi:MAG TPA: bifunctional helix-turn-helix transcriptional regulator/GNAT family N-acetyltransferase [Acidobacteriaceae bacterium]|jgi:DNA-binding MarR family transcriptional regulator/GNAT superfamily N-acetyltransferase|nr:bifunctional helix-turn-helix transcriptional regulator/GNAT family N-acetyltransferase [Acidobacteriaceae bacterium]
MPSPVDPVLAADAAAFRQFNRVYTRFLGTLSEGFLRTEYSLAEGRVLYELATRDPAPQAKEIGATLGLDAGYLSRILTKFEKTGLVTRKTSKNDSRASDLQLTSRGRVVFRTLNTRAEKQAREFLQALPPPARTEFTSAVRTMEQSLAGKQPPPPSWTLRTHRPGDMGIIVALEGAGYVDQFGWDSTFEALVARIVADFIDHFNPQRERCWIAEIPAAHESRHVGHIFLVQHPEQPDTAKLRLLYVDPSARGLGLGQALVETCVAFAREARYRKIVLWTQSILTAAHRLYKNAGFRLVEEQPHHSFGKDLTGQNWELDLR